MISLDVINDALDNATGGAFARRRTMCKNEEEALEAIRNREMTTIRGGVSRWGTIGLEAISAYDNEGHFAETFFWLDE